MVPEQIKPTEAELEILQVLWHKKNATVREVHEMINIYKESGYTTTLKLMQIMYDKKLVIRDESAKKHIYTASVSKERAQKHLVGKMIQSLFGGSATELVMQTLGSTKPSKDELQQIQELLNDLKSK